MDLATGYTDSLTVSVKDETDNGASAVIEVLPDRLSSAPVVEQAP